MLRIITVSDRLADESVLDRLAEAAVQQLEGAPGALIDARGGIVARVNAIASASAEAIKMAFPEAGIPVPGVVAVTNALLAAHAAGRSVTVLTHSEHILLRVSQAIRHGLPPEGVEVDVFFSVDDGEDNLVPVEVSLRFEADGNFNDDFPGGFFPERRELFR